MEQLFDRLHAFSRRIAVAISIAAAGLLPRLYDTQYRKDQYGSIERDERE